MLYHFLIEADSFNFCHDIFSCWQYHNENPKLSSMRFISLPCWDLRAVGFFYRTRTWNKLLTLHAEEFFYRTRKWNKLLNPLSWRVLLQDMDMKQNEHMVCWGFNTGLERKHVWCTICTFLGERSYFVILTVLFMLDVICHQEALLLTKYFGAFLGVYTNEFVFC